MLILFFSNLTRIQRNVAEKQRRDKLNGYISELANIVPMVSMSSKRLDKTSILRLSAAHLRLSKSMLMLFYIPILISIFYFVYLFCGSHLYLFCSAPLPYSLLFSFGCMLFLSFILFS